MSFLYKKSITIDCTKVQSSDQTNFPVLIDVLDTSFKTVANGGHVNNSSGYDIYFYSDINLTTRLAAERESFVASTGELVAWVKIPSLSASVNTTIYIAYGDSSISTDPNSDATYGKTNTWDSNFYGVWHFPDGSSLDVTDSTSQLNTLAATGTPTAATGQIGGGVTTGTGANYLTDTLTTPMGMVNSISGWVKFTSFGSQAFVATAVDGCEIPIGDGAGTADKFGLFGSGWVFGSRLTTGVWYHLYVTRDSSTVSGYKGYLNGVIDITTTRSFTDSGSSMKVGVDKVNDSNHCVNGTIDEVRISNVVRSIDWIVTEYNNQNAPSTFMTFGSEVPTGGGVSRNVATNRLAAAAGGPTSLWLDGNYTSQITQPDDLTVMQINSTDDYSFGCYVNLQKKSNSGNTDDHCLASFDFSFGGNTGHAAYVDDSNGSLNMYFGNTNYASTTGVFTYGAWHQITWTLTGTTLKVYIDKLLVWTQTVVRKATTGAINSYIGQEGDKFRKVYGNMYNFFIIRSLLTQTDVNAIVDSADYPDNLDLFYKMDEGASTVLIDSSPGSNDGITTRPDWRQTGRTYRS